MPHLPAKAYVYDVETNGKGHKEPSGPPTIPTNSCNNRGLTQAYQLRNIAAAQALAIKDCQPANLKERAIIARILKELSAVWSTATDKIRVFKGQPNPGSYRPKPPVKKRKAPTGPLFTMDDSPPAEPQTPPPTELS